MQYGDLVKFGVCVLVFFRSVGLAPAQIPAQDLEQYQRILHETAILANEGNLLPLRRLDTLRPVFLSIGLSSDETLWSTLNAYLPMARMVYEGENINTIFPFQGWAERPNLFILAVDAEGVATSGFPFPTFFRPNGMPMVLILLGESELNESMLSGMRADAVIWSAEAGDHHQSVAAQLVAGALGASAGAAAPDGFQALATEPLGRLAFLSAEVMGLEGRLLRDSIPAIVQDGLDHRAYPSAQVLVAKDGAIVYYEAFGYHTDARERPVAADDIYDLASITKISTALPALMRAYGEGTFELDAPLQRYFPSFAGSNKAGLSFRAMLAHQARLRPWIPFWQGTLRGHGRYPWRRRWDAERTNDYRFRCRTFRRDSSARYPVHVTDDLWLHRDYQKRIYRAIRKSPLREEAEYAYSGLLFYLLPEVVADMTGQDIETYLKETFYQPLGAYTLTYNPLRFYPRERIVPTERDTFFRLQLLHGAVHDEGAAMMGGVSGNAGLFGSAADLAKLMQMYLNGGSYGGRRYLAESAVDTFTTRHYADVGNHRGLGFDKPRLPGDTTGTLAAEAASAASFGHSGYTGNLVWADPENGLLFIFLSNRVYPTRANRGLYLHDIRRRLHRVLYEALPRRD